MSSSSDAPTETGAAPATFSGGTYRLVVIEGPDRGRHLELEAGEHVVGKQRDCALCLDDGQVSRQHLAISVSSDGIRVRDLGSKNGVYLGQARIDAAELYPGSTLRLGRTRLQIVSAWSATERPLSTATQAGRLHGVSRAMREVFAQIASAATSDAAVLIEGETGCGKELCAHAIHAASPRKKKPYVVSDMAALPATLIESELFGHVRGAFTGAHADRTGLVAEADGGTLFLDEIGELALDLQPRLLRAIEHHRYKRVGDTVYRMADLRVIAATNRALEQEISDGKFRADLFYRLAVVRIRMPPLRERKEDIAHLCQLWLAEHQLELSPEAMAVLTEHDWPGNVRELRNAIDRALSLRRPGERVLGPAQLGLDTVAATAGLPWPRLGEPDFVAARDQMVAAWERRYLEQLLARSGGNVSRAAREGGIDRVYLHRLLKRHRLRGR
jgi:DNA-binding NtrC family response regulator